MNITVILCTYNRCRSLANALGSLAASVVTNSVEWEVLVVDNNSNDETRAVVEEFCHRYPRRFRYLFEPQQGKSYALNSGIREARGEVLAFIDDDVTVEPTWLQNLTSVLQGSEWAGSGGRILPAPGFSPPRWLALDGRLNLGASLCAHFDLGDMPCELRDAPYGANMAFRKVMFDRYGGFRTDLGACPDSEECSYSRLPQGEDAEFGRRLMAAGERLRYVPSAVAHHEVHENRVRKGYFLAWWFARGRSLVREAGKSQANGEIPKIIGRTIPKTIRWALTFNSQRRFYYKCMIWLAAGKVAEICSQARGAKEPRDNTMQPSGRAFGPRT